MRREAVALRRTLLLAPLAVAAGGGIAFWTMLDRMKTGAFDPHDIGNPMLGRPVPAFDLPPLLPNQGFSSTDLVQAARTRPVLLNFFASWCIPCAQEAEALQALAGAGVQLWGIAYKDKPENTRAFLDRYGNPYKRLAADSTGATFIDFGLYGVPENFVIDATGKIAFHVAGGVSAGVMARLSPALGLKS